ncbi:hypothetical protein PDJAM_G00118790 [Pangasius djambal]|uniref:Uncharacterized protein n=1 Tax=Pangasius djambal TaxID=1691987 RepID=A0ACC5Z8N0_9TELE|nr:hypothetical protein [Pangasius djambal]
MLYRLWEDGKVGSLDDPLEKYVENFTIKNPLGKTKNSELKYVTDGLIFLDSSEVQIRSSSVTLRRMASHLSVDLYHFLPCLLAIRCVTQQSERIKYSREKVEEKLDTDLASYCALLSLTSARTAFYKEKLETSAQDLCKLHNIISSLLNPPASPAPSSLTADFATFYDEKIEKICQSFTFTSTPTLHTEDSPSPLLAHFSKLATEEILQVILSCNPTTCPLDQIPSTMLQTISQDLLPFITSYMDAVTNRIQNSKGYSYPEETHSGSL